MQNKQIFPFPEPIPFKKLLGPSFIILALGLGSGEVILWPYLSSNYGLGIAWAALVGITFQFFINMEIERYALIKGESVFVGLNKMFSWSAGWFILSTFIGFGIPGIIAAAAKVFAFTLGLEEFKLLAIFFLLLIGLILSASKKVYDVMENTTKIIIFMGMPFIIVLTLAMTTPASWMELLKGLGGAGQGYNFLPSGIALATFFAAFAYSGAGGNLNLTQSIYIKEKGYGMGKYSQKISGLFTNIKKQEQIKLEGETFELNEYNIKNFKAWWKKINLEHLLVFWLIGLVGIIMLMMLSYSTTFGLPDTATGINFVIDEGVVIGQRLAPTIGIIFLVVVAIMLFQTQLGIMDSSSRIMAENLALKILERRPAGERINLSKIYFTFLWAQIAFGIILFSLNFTEPKFLIVLGAIINAFGMFVHIGLVNWMNIKKLPKVLQPKLWRLVIIALAFTFFGAFSLFTIWDSVVKKLIG